MARRDPLDASTLDARRAAPSGAARVPTLRVVFRGERIVEEASRRIEKPELVAGRGAGDEGLELADDPLASRGHARFERTPPAGLSVRDLGSRNGVGVNGITVEHAVLQEGDVVRLGSTLAVVRFEDPHAVDVPDDELLGVSPPMQRLRIAVRRAGPTDATVLVGGETGAGKEVAARSLHRASRRPGAFVAVNCSAIAENLAESLLFGHVAGAFTGAIAPAEGFFRAADQGTLFLDEVGDMAAVLQPKLLRAIETRTFTPVGTTKNVATNVRIVAATHAPLEQAVERGSFRADLYSRLAQLRIELPPLRDRREDVLPLLRRHLGDGAPPMSPDLAEALLLYRYPHNVRELISIATQLRVWGGDHESLELDLLRDHFGTRAGTSEEGGGSDADASRSSPPRPAGPAELPRTRDAWLALLREHEHNLAKVARAIGRSRTQLYRLLEQSGIDRAEWRGR
jgi:DNA-binding NtrC family response regulator